MIGHLPSDVFNQQKCFINGVEMSIRSVKPTDFICILDPENSGVKFHLIEANLRVCRVKILANVLTAQHKALARGNSKLSVCMHRKLFTLHTGVTRETLDNVRLGQLPKRITLRFGGNKAFNGDYKLNTFIFDHHNLSCLCL